MQNVIVSHAVIYSLHPPLLTESGQFLVVMMREILYRMSSVAAIPISGFLQCPHSSATKASGFELAI